MRNTGNVPIENITIDDTEFSGTGTLSAIACPPGFGTLAPNEQSICTATYTLTQADADAGRLDNAAVATGDPVGGPGPITSPESETSIPVDPSASITLTKRAAPSVATAPGDVVTYEFDVTNTGNVTLSGAAITETAFSGTGARPVVTCPSGSFIPGATVTCTATYTLTQADVNAGSVTNTATASAVAPSGPDPMSSPSSATVNIPAAPALTLVKTASLAGEGVAGDVVTYTFEVTNSGNVTITDIGIDETAFSGTGTLGAVTCDDDALDAGQSTTCEATYTLTQADVNTGAVTNTAVATGVRASTTTEIVSLPDAAEVETTSEVGIRLEKSVTPASVAAAGTPVSYSFAITNTGTVDLANPSVTETAFTGSGAAPVVSCPPVVLAPDATVTCTASYTVTQADADAGSVENTAIAAGFAPAGFENPVSDPSSATVTITPAPALTVVKSASPNSEDEFTAGQVITYSFVVTNTGNVTLADVEVIEGDFTGTGPLPTPTCAAGAASLAPGEQVVCETQYTLTQEDVDAGSVTNAATATADPPGPTPPPESPVDEVTIPELAAPAITLVKSTTTSAVTAAGQVVEYEFTVTNAGNTTLTDPTVLEASFSGVGKVSTPVCPPDASPLLPGEFTSCGAEYVVQTGDLTGEPLVNTATASALDPDGDAVASAPSTARIDDVLELPTGGMASSGAEIAWGIVAAALGLIGVGGAVLLMRRRRPATA